MAIPKTQNYRQMVNRNKNQTRCIQINLQHSRAATDSLMKQIEDNQIDVAFIQEPYTYNNKVIGIAKKFRTFNNGKDRCRTAIVITNKKIDALLIKQLSNEDS